MTAIDTTTSQGQLQLRAELERRKLRLQRDPDGTYRLEQWRIGSITRDSASPGRKRVTPYHRWATVATFPNLAAVGAGFDDIEVIS
jgi:hypothetical protein